MDVKTPGSGEAGLNLYDNLRLLKPGDEVKFVLTGAGDYLWAKNKLRELKLDDRLVVNFSSAAGLLDRAKLAKWLVRDRLDVRLNLQFHRILFPGRSRGV
jgi:7-carboxy-7-deazaguanine synthase